MREREARYRELVDNANDTLYTQDLAGRFTSVNRAGELLLGYSREEILRMTIDQVVAPESLPLAHEMIARKIGSRRYWIARDHDPVRKHPRERWEACMIVGEDIFAMLDEALTRARGERPSSSPGRAGPASHGRR